MAVEDKFVNTEVAADKLGNPALIQGATVLGLSSTFEIDSADDDGSKYRIARIPSNYIPFMIWLNSDTITSGTDFDLGFYLPGLGGAVVSADVLVDAVNLSSGLAQGAESNGMANVAIDSMDKKVYELLGKTTKNKLEGYDLVLTGNTVGSASGTFSIRALFIQG